MDSFDIHTQVAEQHATLGKAAAQHGAVSIMSAGWGPGSDSVVRALLEACAPKGITYTNFGPGMSMGHTVAVKAIDGVKAALSMTIPTGTGIHRRMVYIELKEGYDFDKVADAIKKDAYFVHDETHVMQVQSVDALLDMGHGVNLTRKGRFGQNAEPTVRIQYEDQQSGAYGPDTGLLGAGFYVAETGMLHADRNPDDRPASRRPDGTDPASGITGLKQQTNDMLLPIYIYGSAVLRKESEDIAKDYPELDKFLENLWETMYEADGVGLAAPQVGRNIGSSWSTLR